ncbi:MAG: hypothetical protein JWP01_2743 [Myxococcales bacterium]|nr:hypothetical protein [Myxococcales bacterium]
MLRYVLVRTLILVAILATATGCKTDKKAPSTGSGSAGSSAVGSATVDPVPVGSGSANTSVADPAPAPIKLPANTGTPPNKTTAQLDDAQAAKMVALEFPGFKKEVRNDKALGMDVRYRTEARPILSITVKASRCIDCKPMKVEAWDKDALLKDLVPIEVLRDKRTTFELGATDLNGAPAIFVYQLGSLTEKDDDQNTAAAYTNAYTLFYNDGVNMIRVIASYKDQALDVESLQKVAPKEDLERVAKAFMDSFTHAW